MKTIIKTLTLLLCCRFFTTLTIAETAHNGKEATPETEKIINRCILFPNINLPIEQSEKTEVVFTTGDNVKVNFALANPKKLKEIIEKQFVDLYLTAIKSHMACSVTINLKKV